MGLFRRSSSGGSTGGGNKEEQAPASRRSRPPLPPQPPQPEPFALHQAACSGDVEAVHRLLKAGAKLDGTLEDLNLTPVSRLVCFAGRAGSKVAASCDSTLD